MRTHRIAMVFASVIAATLPCKVASAQTSANADAAYAGWLKAYLVRSGGQTYFCNSLTDRSMAFMWGQAYMITGVEDAYDVNHGADRKQLVSDLLKTFEAQNKADLSWDKWNDDAAWATIALVRGYQITGDTTFLSASTEAWDMAYARGWDSTYGGGIWENMDNVPNGGKCGLSNWPFVISGAMIYQSTNDASYLNRSEQIYAWSRANVFDTTTGRVHEQIGPKGVTGDDNAYNSGLLVNAASALYAITRNTQYYNDAVLAANHVIGKYPIMSEDHPANGDFGGDQFFRGLGKLARENDLWTTYSPWLMNNASAAWTHRRTDYNVSMNNFTLSTPSTSADNLRAMEAEGSVIVQAITQMPPPPDAGTPAPVDAGSTHDAGVDSSVAPQDAGLHVDSGMGHGSTDAGANDDTTDAEPREPANLGCSVVAGGAPGKSAGLSFGGLASMLVVCRTRSRRASTRRSR